MAYLFAAFSIVWIVIFLYALSISRRQHGLSQEVEMLRQTIDRQAPSTANASEVSVTIADENSS